MSAQEAIKPTTSTERIVAMDITRGIALLGILLMNIVGFGLYKAYSDPTNNGGATGLNLNVWWMNNLFFEGTMRGMFSILFGAGILIFTARDLKNSQDSSVTDLYFRRLLWMVLFGVIHCYLLLWHGEILYAYGIVGMFAFSFRHLAPKKLMIGAAILLLIATAWTINDTFNAKQTYKASVVANEKKSKGETLTKEETKSIDKWEEEVKNAKANPEQLKEAIEDRSKGYWSIVMLKAQFNQRIESFYLYRYDIWDILAMMLLGMALFKTGVITAAKSNRFYFKMALIGYAIGIPVNYFETANIVNNNFSILSFYQSNWTYDVGRVAVTMGHIALIMLFIKSNWLSFLKKSLAAVGQMAFTNYIMHSLICNFIFLGYGLSMFGK
ncbi:MAG: DUF418 domain-containing protein, partial [Saprospiraceae bacterium]|nr:DUF418 domain-containing protein [Saprospiraceae bacterium]